ncbi:MAG: hypothetical protein NC238_00890 [Dehalobacter sp.]|nr:hypothetical protein [Dehalobacter sp.]
MLFHLLLGGFSVYLFMLLMNHSKKASVKMSWWQWLLTGLGFLYAAFVLEVIYGFLAEGSAQAALIMGLILAIVAVIWGVLLGRFVFTKKAA